MHRGITNHASACVCACVCAGWDCGLLPPEAKASPCSIDRWAALGEPTPPMTAHESWLILIKAALTFSSPCFCCSESPPIALLLPDSHAAGVSAVHSSHSFSTCWPPSPPSHCPPSLSKSNSHYSSFTVLVGAAMGLLDLILPPPQKKKTGFAFRALRQVVLSLQGLLHHSHFFWLFARDK